MSNDPLEHLTPGPWIAIAAVVMGLGGLVTATIVVASYWGTDLLDLSGPYGVQNHVVIAAAGLSAFTTGGLLWWLLIESTGNVHWSSGARVGALTAIVSHLMTLLAVVFLQWFSQAATNLSLPVIVDLFVSASFYGLLSILGFGLITIPVGTVLGIVLARLRRPSVDESQSASGGGVEKE